MTPYFTKWIAEEGKIKAHSFALLDKTFANASIVRVMSTAKYYSNVSADGTSWDVMTNRLTPVSLVLCDRKLQVNDKIIPFEVDSFWGDYHKRNNIVRDIKPTEKGSLDNGKSLLILLGGNDKVAGNWFYEREFFKPIGKLSDQAMLFSKEGDINEENIALGAGYNNFRLTDIETEGPDKSDKVWGIKKNRWPEYDIRVKGPDDEFY